VSALRVKVGRRGVVVPAPWDSPEHIRQEVSLTGDLPCEVCGGPFGGHDWVVNRFGGPIVACSGQVAS
jgi:hypothetical protein